MAYVVCISEFFTELISTSDDTLDAFTDGVPVGEKNDGDEACIG
jgi:hypothetical protein